MMNRPRFAAASLRERLSGERREVGRLRLVGADPLPSAPHRVHNRQAFRPKEGTAAQQATVRPFRSVQRRSSKLSGNGNQVLLFGPRSASKEKAMAIGSRIAALALTTIAVAGPGGGARTTEFLDCGQLSAYRPYAGSPTYYTSWTYHPTNAYRADPGGQILTNHNGSSSGRSYFSLSS